MEAHTYKQLVVDRSVVILRVIESARICCVCCSHHGVGAEPRMSKLFEALRNQRYEMVYKPISEWRSYSLTTAVAVVLRVAGGSSDSEDYLHSDSCLFTLKWMFMAALKCNSADNRHLPLLLTCSHSFCSSCLAVMGRTQKYSGHIKCPECKVGAARGVTAAEVGLNST